LLDEADFLAQLGTFEDGIPAQRRESKPIPGLPTPLRMTPNRSVHDDDDGDAGPTIMEQIAAAAMFALLIGVGAAGAAMVFHERFVRILARW
jgi:hypothetical protein